MPNATSFDDTTIVPFKRNRCRNHFRYMSQDEAINLFRNYKTWKFFIAWKSG